MRTQTFYKDQIEKIAKDAKDEINKNPASLQLQRRLSIQKEAFFLKLAKRKDSGSKVDQILGENKDISSPAGS